MPDIQPNANYLDTIAPWGRGMQEYVAMFALTDDDLRRPILDCGAGPSSFNAEMTLLGHSVTSCDPMYRLSGNQIRRRIDEVRPDIMDNVRINSHLYVWTTIRSPEHLEDLRMRAMRRFLADLDTGRQEGRYRAYELPQLRFDDSQFSLALVSHLLFLYSEQLTADFHIRSMRELLRVANEVRVFPVLAFGNVRSPHLDPVISALQSDGFTAELKKVDYEFMVGGNEMLVVRK